MEKINKTLYVTEPSLPPLDEFVTYLEKIWESKWLTNAGEFHQQLELELAKYLGVKYVSLFSNGTLALVTALQALRITGEVITTPFSFVATTHALWWNNIKPVFVDIESEYCNLDPAKIEAAITPLTTAILPVHVYGNSANVEEIQRIADIYGLKVIYDAAHAFGVKYKNESVLNFGDLSVLSFHATKVFNTFEGGAIISHDAKTKQRIDYLKNFGFAGEAQVVAAGINGKMNEVQAAMGLLQLKYIDGVLEKRKQIAMSYRLEIESIEGLTVLPINEQGASNYSYLPIFIDKRTYGLSRDELFELFKRNNIYARRYFYPLISDFPTYRALASSAPDNLPTARTKAEEVLCLPIFPDMTQLQLNAVFKILNLKH